LTGDFFERYGVGVDREIVLVAVVAGMDWVGFVDDDGLKGVGSGNLNLNDRKEN